MTVGIRSAIGDVWPGRASRPETHAFAEAVRPHLPAMVRLAVRLAPTDGSDDVVQEALMRAWRHWGRFDSNRGSLSAWLLAIVANEARRAVARHRGPTALAPIRGPASLEDRADLAAAVRRLPPRQRLAIDCFYFAGISVAETAVVMGCTEGTVKSTLADARARLRRELQEETDEER